MSKYYKILLATCIVMSPLVVIITIPNNMWVVIYTLVAFLITLGMYVVLAMMWTGYAVNALVVVMYWAVWMGCKACYDEMSPWRQYMTFDRRIGDYGLMLFFMAAHVGYQMTIVRNARKGAHGEAK